MLKKTWINKAHKCDIEAVVFFTYKCLLQMSASIDNFDIKEEKQKCDEPAEDGSPSAKKIRLNERTESEEKDKDDDGLSKHAKKNTNEERIKMQ